MISAFALLKRSITLSIVCAVDCKHPCLDWGGSPSTIALARMLGVYPQGLCTMQSQLSIHSLSRREMGLGIRQGCRDRTPKPISLGERLCMLGWLCIVQSPCAYTPGIRAGAILLGLPPQTKQGCLQSAAQSHCTMQWHKWLTTCTGASPLRPRF